VSRLILWDVDGTLLRTGGAGRHALEQGAAVAAGLDEVPHVVMSGKTDPLIITEILNQAGLSQERIDAILPRACEVAEQTLADSIDRIRQEGMRLPGVVDILDALSRRDGVRQTLVTGNLKPNAAVKVGAFELERYVDLEVGAYGSDHIDRNELVPIAVDRVRKLRGERYAADEVWVVGDTDRDLACARAAGVRCLLVGDDVGELGAECAVADLADTAQIMKLLLD
jgi:phosphoglycolate phosphatase